MGKIFKGLFGGGGDEAAKAAELSRQQQDIANQRQLAAMQASGAGSETTRRNPRGRRLFSSAAQDKTNLS
jgi:hypothetical protein